MRNAVGRINSGPAANPNSLRRDRRTDQAGWTQLPASGRSGDAPEWPLSRTTAGERAMWAALWRMPQAIMWERNRLELEVARHVRAAMVADRAKAPTSLKALVQRQMESLGLTTLGMRALRWQIVDDAPAAASGEHAEPESIESARDRFQLVAGGGA